MAKVNKTRRMQFFISKQLEKAVAEMAEREAVSVNDLLRALIIKHAKQQGLWPPEVK